MTARARLASQRLRELIERDLAESKEVSENLDTKPLVVVEDTRSMPMVPESEEYIPVVLDIETMSLVPVSEKRESSIIEGTE